MTRLINHADTRAPIGFGIETRLNDGHSGIAYSTIQPAQPCWCTRTATVRRSTLFILAVLLLAFCAALIVCLCFVLLRTEPQLLVASSPLSSSQLSLPRTDAPLSATPNLTARIPLDVVPVQYKIAILPDIYSTNSTNFSFYGWMIVTLSVARKTDRIFLHAHKLNVDWNSAELCKGSAGDREPLPLDDKNTSTSTKLGCVAPAAYFNHSQFLYYELAFNELLTADSKYTLKLQWTGKILIETRGLYQSYYEADDGTHYLAVTQFEPTHAREAFPCVDEPGTKAVFLIRILRARSHRSMSNAELERTTSVWFNNEQYAVDVYKATPKMSSYIVAFVVCDYDYRQIVDAGVTYRFWGRSSSLAELDYIMQITPLMMHYMQQEFKIPYQLTKLDSVGIPHFSAQAMENWGLITYMETYYYYNKSKDSLLQRQQLATLVGHELAHMWFGNLVTMKWWDNVWIKEGFATYYSYQATASVEPSFDIITTSVVSVAQMLLLDSVQTTRSVYSPVSDPFEIEATFDTITYDKAAALCRMMSTILGEKTFQKAIQLFLNWFKFGTVEFQDLLRAMSVQSSIDGGNHDMSDIMNKWLSTPNYPLVTIIQQRNTSISSALVFRLTQHLFTPEGEQQDDSRSWRIPVSILLDGSTEPETVWFPDGIFETNVEVPSTPKSPQWYVVNSGYGAYYRVNYDSANWREIIRLLQMNHTALSILVRVQLVDDVFALASSNLVDFSTFLNLTLYLRNERQYQPWQVAINNLAYMRRLLSRTSVKTEVQVYLRYLLDPLYSYVSWQANATESPTTTFLRRLILEESCNVAVPSCISKAKSLFAEWQATKGSTLGIIPELTQTVRCSAIKHGTNEDWMYLYALYNHTERPLDRVGYALALACSQNVSHIKLLLDTLFKNADLNSQEFVETFSTLCQNPAANELLKQYFFENINLLWQSHPGLLLLLYLYDGSANAADIVELRSRQQQFNELGPAAETLVTALQSIEKNIRWLQQHQEAITSWLTSFNAMISS